MHLLQFLLFLMSLILVLAPVNACKCFSHESDLKVQDWKQTRECCKFHGKATGSDANTDCLAHSISEHMTEFAICCTMN
jgi:hypothetical protein